MHITLWLVVANTQIFTKQDFLYNYIYGNTVIAYAFQFLVEKTNSLLWYAGFLLQVAGICIFYTIFLCLIISLIRKAILIMASNR